MNGEDSSVCTAGALNEWKIRPTAFGGHSFYVRKCLPGTPVDPDDPKLCQVDGVIIPPGTGNQVEWFECRAVGPRVGQRCSDIHAKKYRTSIIKRYGLSAATSPSNIPTDLKGKRLFIALPYPLVDERVAQSPLADFEHFVEETLPSAYMVEDE